MGVEFNEPKTSCRRVGAFSAVMFHKYFSLIVASILKDFSIYIGSYRIYVLSEPFLNEIDKCLLK